MIGQNREADITKEHRSQTQLPIGSQPPESRLAVQHSLKFEISTKRERGCERNASGISHSSYTGGRGEAAVS